MEGYTRPDTFTAWWVRTMANAHAGEGLRERIGRLEARVTSLTEQLSERDDDVRDLTRSLSRKNKEVRSLKEKVGSLKEELDKRPALVSWSEFD